MVLKLVNKLNKLSCDSVFTFHNKLLAEHYGIETCATNGMSKMDENPKFQKIKRDFLAYYSRYEEIDMDYFKNNGCDILNLIKKI